jgi:integrase
MVPVRLSPQQHGCGRITLGDHTALALAPSHEYGAPFSATERIGRSGQIRTADPLLPKQVNRTPADFGGLIRLHDEVTARGAAVEANRQIDLIRGIYSWAIGRRLISINPAARLPSNPERSRERVLSPDEIHAFWHSLERISIHAPTRMAIKLLLLTGQRAGEITGARTDEVDLGRAAWTIPRSRTKNGRTHMVPLSGSAAALFAEALKTARDGFVFPSPKEGQAMTRRALSRAISRNRIEIGVGAFTPHDLRRTVASLMAAAGIDRLVVSKVLRC